MGAPQAAESTSLKGTQITIRVIFRSGIVNYSVSLASQEKAADTMFDCHKTNTCLRDAGFVTADQVYHGDCEGHSAMLPQGREVRGY